MTDPEGCGGATTQDAMSYDLARGLLLEAIIEEIARSGDKAHEQSAAIADRLADRLLGEAEAHEEKSMRILIVGDSQAAGPPGAELEARLRALGHETRRVGYVGHGAYDWIRVHWPEYQAALSTFRPDQVVMIFGSNDPPDANLEQAMRTWKASAAKVYYAGPPRYDLVASSQALSVDIRDMAQRVFGAKHLDAWPYTGPSVPRAGAGLHFTSAGGAMWAEGMVQDLAEKEAGIVARSAAPGRWGQIVTQDGFRYQITDEDVLWAARAAKCEGGGATGEKATLWTWTARFALPAYRAHYPTLTRLIRAHSQPVNPIWARGGTKCAPGAPSHGSERCSESALARREACSSAAWNTLPTRIRTTVTQWAMGQLPNPVPQSVDFASSSSGVQTGDVEIARFKAPTATHYNVFYSEPASRALPADYVTIWPGAGESDRLSVLDSLTPFAAAFRTWLS